MANFDAFCWNILSSTNFEIMRSGATDKIFFAIDVREAKAKIYNAILSFFGKFSTYKKK